MTARHREMYTDDWVTVLGIVITIAFLIWLGLRMAG